MKRILLVILLLPGLISAMAQQIVKMEYFVDTDPGFGNGINIPVSASSDVSANFDINTTGLVPGVHMLGIRAMENGSGGEDRVWSTVASGLFMTVDLEPLPDVSYMEYFVDTDPGYGMATPVPVSGAKNISAGFPINVTGLVPGIHMVVVRVKNSYNEWSVAASATFFNLDVSIPDIVRMEYFMDNDPGFGNGIQIPISAGKDVSEVIVVDTTGLSLGRHYLVVRAENSKNAWGMIGYQEFTFFKTKLFLEGLYMPFTGMMYPAQGEFGDQWGPGVADHVTLEFHAPNPPYDVVYQEESELQTNGAISLFITHHLDDSYLGIKHRNSIETWSSSPVQIPSMTAPYDFTGSLSMAYGDNMRDMGDGSYAIWGGDVNQDGIVDGGDMNPVDNASTAITFGYVPEDLNGDGIVDGGDMNLADNNSTMIIMAFLP